MAPEKSHILMDFNVTECEQFIGMILNSTLQLNLQEIPTCQILV